MAVQTNLVDVHCRASFERGIEESNRCDIAIIFRSQCMFTACIHITRVGEHGERTGIVLTGDGHHIFRDE